MSNDIYTEISLIQMKNSIPESPIIVINQIKIRLRFSRRISNFIHEKTFLIPCDNIKTSTAKGNNARYHNPIKQKNVENNANMKNVIKKTISIFNVKNFALSIYCNLYKNQTKLIS